MTKIINYTNEEYQEIWNLLKNILLSKKEFQDNNWDMDDKISDWLNLIIVEMNKLIR